MPTAYQIEQRRQRVMNHASDRYFERYGTRLTIKMYAEFVRRVKTGESIPLHRIGTRTVHDVDGTVLVYRKGSDEIVTFLPTDCREKMQANGNRYKTWLEFEENKLLESVELSTPSAGEGCANCEAEGHFCQATLYIDGDEPICAECNEGEACARNRALDTSSPATFEPTAVNDYAPSPARSIPREEWPADEIVKQSSTETQGFLSKPRGPRDPIPEAVKAKIIAEPGDVSSNQLTKKYGISLATICRIRREAGVVTLWTAVNAGESKSAPKPPGNRIDDLIREAIVREPASITNQEVADKYKVSAASVINFRRAAGMEIAPPPGPGRIGIPHNRGGHNRETEKREQAKELIVAGHSVRGAAEQVGLCQSTVSKAKLEIPPEKIPDKPIWRPDPRAEETDAKVAEAIESGLDHLSDVAAESGVDIETARRSIKRNGGEIKRAHVEGSMDQEVSVERRESVKVSTRTSPNFAANPVLVALLQYLPPVGEEFTINQRVKWLNAAISMMELLYTAPDSEDWMLCVNKDSLV